MRFGSGSWRRGRPRSWRVEQEKEERLITKRMKDMRRLLQPQTAFACPSFSAIVAVGFGVGPLFLLRSLIPSPAARNFQHPLTSFAFLPSPLDPTSTHFLGVSRDTSSPGTSGHRLEVIELPPTQHSAFLDRGLLVSSDAAPSGFSTFHIEPPPPEVPVTGDEVESPEGLKANRILLARGRTLSLNVASLPAFDRNRTPRPSGSVTPRRLSRSGDTQAGPAEQDVLSRSGLAALSTDVSVLMRQRVEKGCGSDVS